MTRSQKINKLANAIRDYRGAYHQNSGVWIRTPKPDAALRVHEWLDRLAIEGTEAWKAINGFKTVNEFREWIKRLP